MLKVTGSKTTVSESESNIRRPGGYDIEKKKEQYRRAGLQEEEIELVFTPITRYVKDSNISAKARAAHDKFIAFTHTEKDVVKEKERIAWENRYNEEKEKQARKGTLDTVV